MLPWPPALLLTLIAVTQAGILPALILAAATASVSSNISFNGDSPPETLQSPNTRSPALRFLGVDCYHLSLEKDTVSLRACQPLFALLVRYGHIYERDQYYNGFTFQVHGQEPCIVKIFSPARDDRLSKIGLSISQIISYTTEVLQTCHQTGTGGANIFEGNWRVSVSQHVITTHWDLASAGSVFANSSISTTPFNSTPTSGGIVPTSPSPNNASVPAHHTNFLGVQCYHLHPEVDSVDLITCQPLFAQIFSKGNVHEPKSFRNGFAFQTRGSRSESSCFISISSPDPRDRYARVPVSSADVVRYASEVLRECGGEASRAGTGGYVVFEGQWRVQVSKSPVKIEKKRQ